ncbi:hypothetical protein SO802_029232 [Lithocarpus litseifolius]|uniref:Uncharacterized protein n=1 Tax=Lithocarpus litseifolius TaxID=425828 RepID=A0AAW2BU55_9ROSI
MRRERPLTVVQVGQRSSRSRESVQEELRAVLAAEQASGDASDDDETQPPFPEDLVQETPISSNGCAEDLVQETPTSSIVRKKHGRMLMQRIWSLPANLKIECGLNVHGQPIGASGQTFKRGIEEELKDQAEKEMLPKRCIERRSSWKNTRMGNTQEYAALVDYWFSPTTQTLIDTNKRSRGFQKDIARSGPISFAQTPENMAKESGQVVEHATLFTKVYCTKDGSLVSTTVKDKILEQKHKEEITELHAKHKEQIAEALAEAKRQSDA